MSELSDYIDAWVERQRSTFWDWLRRRLGLPDPYAPEPEPEPAPGPDTTSIPGSDAFLWKPVSESNGKLAVLLPRIYRLAKNDPYNGYANARVVTSLRVEGGDRDGDKPKSMYWPTPKPGEPYVNGNRVHTRWGAAGKDFGKDIRVIAEYEGGHTTWTVKDGSRRTTL